MQPFRKTRPRCHSETMSRNGIKMSRRTIKREVLHLLIVQTAGFLVIANILFTKLTPSNLTRRPFRTQERDRDLHLDRIKQPRLTAKLETL